MADYTLKRIDEMEAVFGGAFKRARAELGVESFGVQVIDIPPNIDRYPEHNHADEGQEEVFVPMSGSVELELDGERHRLEPGMMVRIGPDVNRKLITHEEPVRLLALGGVPGKAYEPPDLSKPGGADPLAQQQS